MKRRLGRCLSAGHSITGPPKGCLACLVEMTERSTRWAFTAYEAQWPLFDNIPDIVKEWSWQTEICPTSGRKHYQGWILTNSQQRHSALTKALPGVHIEVAKNWSALIRYCSKIDTRDASGCVVHEVNQREYLTLDKALMKIAEVWNTDLEKELLGKEIQGHPLYKPKEVRSMMFRSAIQELVRQNPADIGYYVRPDVERGWNLAGAVFLEKRQTDRQTTVRIIDGWNIPDLDIDNGSSSSVSPPSDAWSPPRSSDSSEGNVSVSVVHRDVQG